jgi:hypothetical protein
VFANRVGDSDEENPAISDGQLWQIAYDGIAEMSKDREQYGMSDRSEPGAMGIIAWGNEIIISSSMKGAGSFSYDFNNGDTHVGRSLEMCQILFGDWDPERMYHNNNGNCAELMGFHLYYKQNTVKMAEQKARIGTFVYQGVKNGWAKTEPCGPDKDPNAPKVRNESDVLVCTFQGLTKLQIRWGCDVYTAIEGVRVLDNTTPSAPYTRETLAGGPVQQDQIQTCGGDPIVFWQQPGSTVSDLV